MTFSKIILHRLSCKFKILPVENNLEFQCGRNDRSFPCILPVAETKYRSCLNKILSNELLISRKSVVRVCSYFYFLFLYLQKEKQVTYYIFNNNTQPIHYLSLIDRKD